MSDALHLHGLGAVVEVRCDGRAAPELVAAMRRAWSRCLSPTGGAAAGDPDDGSHDPVAAGTLEVRLDDVGELARTLMHTTQDVTRALIGARAGHLLMLHAGALGDPATGRTVAYVARGGTGKTTLSRLLGQRLGYLTDETVGVDASGRVAAYPKPLSVRREHDPDTKDELSPDALGLLPAPTAPRLTRLVLLVRRADVRTPDVEELAFMDAALALAEQSSSLAALPRPLHRLGDLVDEVGPVVRLTYAEADDAADLLLDLAGPR